MKNMQKKKNGYWEARVRIHSWDKVEYLSLGTKDRVVAQTKLDKLYEEMEREAAGIGIPKKIKVAAQQPLSELVKKYLHTLEASETYINQTGSRIKRLCKACDWKNLKDVDSVSFQEWRASNGDLTPKTKNHFLSSIHSFCTWLVDNGLAAQNPLSKVKPVKVRGKQKFQYRALSMDELRALVSLEGKRSLIYQVAAYTGLRWNEIRLLQWGDLFLDASKSYLVARESTTKNSNKAPMILQSDLVPLLKDLRSPDTQPEDVVFPYMPDNKTVKRDFEKAGIETNNARDEKASFHSLRETFCMMLHNSGVHQRVAQQAMRHSDARLTNDVYVDRSLLPMEAAYKSLPKLSGPSPDPSKSDLQGQNVAYSGAMAEDIKALENAGNLEKQKESSGFEEFLMYKKWCTRMESNHHAVASTRT